MDLSMTSGIPEDLYDTLEYLIVVSIELTINNDWLYTSLGIVVFSILVTGIIYYKRDNVHPEPFWALVFGIGLGILSALTALIILVLVDPLISFSAKSYTVVPVFEELIKGLFLIPLIKLKKIRGPLDGLVYGAMVGIGFDR